MGINPVWKTKSRKNNQGKDRTAPCKSQGIGDGLIRIDTTAITDNKLPNSKTPCSRSRTHVRYTFRTFPYAFGAARRDRFTGGGGGGFFARDGGGGGGAFFNPIVFKLVALGLRDGTLP